MRLKKPLVLIFWILAVLLSGTAVLAFFSRNQESVPQENATLTFAGLIEASGLAASHRSPGMLWSHNDSGGQPTLFAFDTDGRERGRVRVQGVKNVDWEALSTFELDGKSWIAIGDIGDNNAGRRNTTIHVIEEPPPESLHAGRELPLSVQWSIPYRFETGPRDCEAMMVDPRLRTVFLISKRNHPPGLHTLPLQPVFSGKSTVLVAKKIGEVAHVPAPTFIQRLFPTARGRYRGQPTDACLSPDGLSVAVLTYGDVLVYRRNAGQTWESALNREPERVARHSVPQAEGLSFSLDGKALFVIGELRNPTLLRFDLSPR